MEKKSIIIIIILIILGVGAGIGGYFIGTKKSTTKSECPKEEIKKEEFQEKGNKHWEKRTAEESVLKYENILADDKLEYEFHLSNEGVLTVNYSINEAKWVENVKIAEDIEMFDVIHTGNAGYYNVYYLKEGKVYCVYLDEDLLGEKELESKELDDLKNIEYFSEFAGPDAYIPLFVDKDGNIVTSSKINE